MKLQDPLRSARACYSRVIYPYEFAASRWGSSGFSVLGGTGARSGRTVEQLCARSTSLCAVFGRIAVTGAGSLAYPGRSESPIRLEQTANSLWVSFGDVQKYRDRASENWRAGRVSSRGAQWNQR